MTALERVLRNTGSQTPGVDGVTLRQFKDEAFKRVLGGHRRCPQASHLRAPTLSPGVYSQALQADSTTAFRHSRDRGPHGSDDRDHALRTVVRRSISPFSYGFRPGRSTHQALGRTMHFLNHSSGRWHWILEGDIEACFDRVHHDILLKLLKKRVQDERLLGLIHAFLTAGVMEDGRFQRTDHGTPQGVCSPLLMNVYLHEFDARLEARYIAPHIWRLRAKLPVADGDTPASAGGSFRSAMRTIGSSYGMGPSAT